MRKIQFYMRENCALCDEAKVYLDILQSTYSFEVEAIDIYKDDALLLEYQIIIPVLKIGDATLIANDMSLEAVEQFILDNC